MRFSILAGSIGALLFFCAAGCGSSSETEGESSPEPTSDASQDTTSPDSQGFTVPDAQPDARDAARSDAKTDGDAAACVPHTGAPVIDPTTLPACSCAGAHCLSTGLVPAASAKLLADCDAMSKCVPDGFIASGGDFIAPSCTSVAGAEGRCLSKCLPDVQAKAAQLPQATCAADELCTPCFDPISGASTGACNLSCDPGPKSPPVTFGKCCGGKGTCLPSSAVPDSQKSQLGKDTCDADGGDDLCAPDAFTAAGGFVPTTCKSLADAEGRCLPSCLPSIASQAASLPVSTCTAGELCAPCFDPITGADTGACHLSNDPGPANPTPVTFPKCCDDKGTCVPSSSVPDAEKSQLAAGSCPSDTNDYLCAPTPLVTPAGFVPKSCRSLFDAEGRCLSTCLATIAAQANTLPQSTCAADELCAPCYDPVSGADTGACHVSKDPGPQEPPFSLPKCCSGNGTCVPSSSVPDAEKAELGFDSCPHDANNYLCAPTELTAPGGFTPDTCQSLGGGEGRCLSPCLPAIAAQAASLPQSTCAANHVCAPCYDPLSGADTGACHVSNDPGPANPPFTFPKCCGNDGTCVPSASVPDAEKSQLDLGSCPADANDYLCSPTELTAAGGITPPTCASVAGGEGRCLSTCLSSVAAQAAQLPVGTCATGHLCAPCYDPLSGADTGACHVSNDPGPANPPFTFPKCCSGNATCVPSAEVPTSEQSQLGTDSCPADGNAYLCAPNELTAAGGYVPPTCRSLGNGEGRCLSTCLPSIAAQATELPQSTCATGHLCAPCYDPLTGADTQACHVSNDPGPQEPPFTFPGCCTASNVARGVCVPTSLVPTARQSLLGADTCPGDAGSDSYLCVAPRAFATNPSFKPPSCTGTIIVAYTGVCLPNCLPSLSGAAGFLIPQGSCASANDKCAPCVNPLTQANTGACN